MRELRVVLIGGTSSVGKTTAAHLVAKQLGFECRSTDGLAKHPGRPWRTPGRDVPAHVAEHYISLGVDELVASVLGHYESLWPRIEELITAHAAGDSPRVGLVLEGSALWPTRVAALRTSHTAAIWLTAPEATLRDRIHTASHYPDATPQERHLIDKFLSRTTRYQALVVDVLDRLQLDRVNTSSGQLPRPLAATLLTAAEAQKTVGRSAAMG